MTCDQAIEFLPWYLNGTLEPGELAEVRQHLETCESCRAALAETGQAWAVFAQERSAQQNTRHLSAQTLVALAWGETPAGIDAAAAEAHLDSCAECAAQLEMARMSRRLEEEENVVPFPTPRPRPATRSWRAAALAAGLAAMVAAGGWLHAVRQPLPLAAGRQASVPQSANVIDLGNSDAVRSQESAKRIRRDQLSTLLLPAAKDASSAAPGEREAEIVDAGDKVVWKEPHLRPVEIGSYYSVAFPPRSLAAGRYTLRLFSRGEGQSRVPRETWPLEVVGQP